MTVGHFQEAGNINCKLFRWEKMYAGKIGSVD